MSSTQLDVTAPAPKLWLVLHGHAEALFTRNRHLFEEMATIATGMTSTFTGITLERVQIWPRADEDGTGAGVRFDVRMVVADSAGEWLEYWDGVANAITRFAESLQDEERSFILDRIKVAVDKD